MTSPERQRQIRNRELYKGDPDLISRANPSVVHGKASTYTNWGCRCEECKRGWSIYVQESKNRRASREVPEHLHGTQNAYGNYACRCRPCKTAWAVATRERAQRRALRKRAEEKAQ